MNDLQDPRFFLPGSPDFLDYPPSRLIHRGKISFNIVGANCVHSPDFWPGTADGQFPLNLPSCVAGAESLK